MFRKYQNKFKKIEAEAVQEILDMHDGNELMARANVIKAARGKPLPDHLPKWFTVSVQGMFFANRDWWYTGLVHRGLIKDGEDLPPIPEELR